LEYHVPRILITLHRRDHELIERLLPLSPALHHLIGEVADRNLILLSPNVTALGNVGKLARAAKHRPEPVNSLSAKAKLALDVGSVSLIQLRVELIPLIGTQGIVVEPELCRRLAGIGFAQSALGSRLVSLNVKSSITGILISERAHPSRLEPVALEPCTLIGNLGLEPLRTSAKAALSAQSKPLEDSLLAETLGLKILCAPRVQQHRPAAPDGLSRRPDPFAPRQAD
jgi:hypothetical protein